MAQDLQINDMLNELECRVCFNYLKPPIRMCITGHSICDECRQQMKICPFCKSNFSTGRNITLEGVAQKIKYPCGNAKYGCIEKIKCEALTEHEKHCHYKMIKCPKIECSFTGILQDHVGHCGIQHNLNISKITFMNNIKKDQLLKQINNYFWYRSKIVHQKVYFSVQIIGNTLESSNYKYKIVFNNNVKNISFTDTCKSLSLDDNDLFNKNNSFCLSLECCNFYIDDRWQPTITIEKIETRNLTRFKRFFFLLIVIYICQYFYRVDYTKLLLLVSDNKVHKQQIEHQPYIFAVFIPVVICMYFLIYKIFLPFISLAFSLFNVTNK